MAEVTRLCAKCFIYRNITEYSVAIKRFKRVCNYCRGVSIPGINKLCLNCDYYKPIDSYIATVTRCKVCRNSKFKCIKCSKLRAYCSECSDSAKKKCQHDKYKYNCIICPDATGVCQETKKRKAKCPHCIKKCIHKLFKKDCKKCCKCEHNNIKDECCHCLAEKFVDNILQCS